MTAPDSATILWVDAAGNPGSSRFHVPTATSDADVITIANAMQGLSSMKAESALRTKTIDYAGEDAIPLDGTHPYADDRNALVMSFEVPSTSQHVFVSIPGPKTTVGIGNDLRIDPAAAVFDDLKTAVAACVTTQEGAASGSLERGALRTRHLPRAT